ncbi:hypothetical protein FIV06_30170 (plasmid) [Labrenzia sp. THAF191b]|nr:hypothetical protein FIV06_30170 [Labrenzia sp. THAF191b]QFT07942.1 hypothetical protein FIV05_29620 [Labrenzia sp. THAF191a]QFT19693.1 hypothetical protein FIV03_30675 [Labrenzia sp. THAF187b]
MGDRLRSSNFQGSSIQLEKSVLDFYIGALRTTSYVEITKRDDPQPLLRFQCGPRSIVFAKH